MDQVALHCEAGTLQQLAAAAATVGSSIDSCSDIAKAAHVRPLLAGLKANM